MSKRNPKTPEGIRVRHQKGCGSRQGRGCNCSPSYQAYVYDKASTRQVFRSFPSLADAKAWRAEATVAANAGSLRPAGSTPKLADYLRDLLDRMRDGRLPSNTGRPYKPGTVRNYTTHAERYLLPRLGGLRLHEIRRRDVQAMIDKMRDEGISEYRIKGTLDPLRVAITWAIRDDHITVSPLQKLITPKPQRNPIKVPAPAQVPAYLDAVPADERALWATAFYAGLRRGELRALRWKAVDLEGQTIHVTESWDDNEGPQRPKSDAGLRVVPIIRPLVEELARHSLETGRGIDREQDGDQLVFGRTATEPFSTTTAQRRSAKAFAAAGLEHVTLHNARHSATSYLLRAGLEMNTVRAYLGHSDIRMTDHYAHVLPGAHKADADRIDQWLAEQV